MVGCATAKKHWEIAKSTDTIAAYKEFLTKYPKSAYFEEAHRRLEELLWLNALQQNTIAAYEEYLQRWPKYSPDAEAQKRLEQLYISKCPKFPWPPPQASATVIIPSDFVRKPTSATILISDVVQKFKVAFDLCGYVEKSYYAVPDGFAIVTRLEQINHDGTPKKGKSRWAMEIQPVRNFSLEEYLRALFLARAGYYRIIVFIFTPHPFSQSDAIIKPDEAKVWLSGGLNVLPHSISEKEYLQEYVCTALIYEFEQHNAEKRPEIKIPGRLTGETHLMKANLWQALEK
jgi:hypothetical protein